MIKTNPNNSTFIEKLEAAQSNNRSKVCVGLDPDLLKIPKHLLDDAHPIFLFNKKIIDATWEHVCAYKPQIAYYAAQSAEDELQMTIDYIHTNYPTIPVILDAKRSDIGTTAQMYAREAFDRYKADAVTVNPYLGFDSLKPFLDYSDKGVIILCRTSNPSAIDLQNHKMDNQLLYQLVAQKAAGEWNYNKNILLVVGATYPEELGQIRSITGDDIPFLVPGIGAQGGDLEKVLKNGINSKGTGLIISSSRAIIYASNDKTFDLTAKEAVIKLNNDIKNLL